MNEELLEKYDALVKDMADMSLYNMSIELGKKYQDKHYHINASLTSTQVTRLTTKHEISRKILGDVYSAFQDLQPTEHLQSAMDAFRESGGNVDIEPSFDETSGQLNVDIRFVIKDKQLKRIVGLSTIEDFFVRMNAMLQVANLLADDAHGGTPSF